MCRKANRVSLGFMIEIRVFSRNPNFLAEKVEREAKATHTGSRVRLPYTLLVAGKKKKFFIFFIFQKKEENEYI